MTTKLLPLRDIADNPWQMWQLDAGKVAKLAEGYAAGDPIPAIVVRPDPKKAGLYQCAVGHHRRAARALAQQAEVLAEIRELTDLQMATLAIKENFDRGVPTALDKARAAERLAAAPFKQSNEQIAAVLGFSDAASVTNVRKLLKLPVPVQAEVEQGRLPERLARQLVNVTPLAPEAVAELGQELATAPADEREELLSQGLDDLLNEHGRYLADAAFEPHWPEAPIALEKPVDGLTHLRACTGCPHKFTRQGAVACTLPACFDLKQERGLVALLATLSERLHVPVLGEGEQATLVFDRHDYDGQKAAAALVKAAAAHPELGLRIKAAEDNEKPYWMRHVLGSDRLTLVSTDTKTAKKFINAFNQNGQNGAAAKVATVATSNGKAPTAAQLAKQKQAEEELREERRAERAAKWRVEADVVWLVQKFTDLVAAQLTISGGVLGYVVERLAHKGSYRAGNFYGLLDWREALEKLTVVTKGKELDAARRKLLVAAEVFEFGLPHAGPEPTAWRETVDLLGKLASKGVKSRYGDWDAGFDVKLPAGWEKAPTHRTEYNCWTCGTFTGNNTRALSKRDMAEGWVQTYDGPTLKRVTCPNCATVSADKAPAKRAKQGKRK